jgi:phage I-like protein
MKNRSAQRFRTTPIALRLTENDDGIRIPDKVQLFRTGSYKQIQPNGKVAEFTITRETLAEMLQNFKDQVRGIDLAVDFGHKSDEEAAAWIKGLELRDVGGEAELWAEVDWTPDGHAAVAAKKYRYLSPDFTFQYTDNESGKKFGATLFGAGLTNRPVIKNMAPAVELTEGEIEMDEKELEALQAKAAEADALKSKVEELTLKLAESDDDEDEDDDEPSDKKKKSGEKEMNFEELKAAYAKQCEEMADLRKNMAKSLSEIEAQKKEATFNVMLSEGKVVPAQKDAWLKNDMAEFVKLSQPVKMVTVGADGKPVETKTTTKTPAQDEVLKLAEAKVKSKEAANMGQAISMVLAEKRELNSQYQKEVEGPGAEA